MKDPMVIGFRILVVSVLALLLVLLWILAWQSFKQGHPAVSMMCGILMAIIIKGMFNVIFEKTSNVDKHSLGYQ